MSKLTETIIRKASLPSNGRLTLTDGNGLQLRITPNGVRSWSLQYNFLGKKRKITIGQHPPISLKEARKIADRYRVDVAKGIDPIAEKIAAKQDAAQQHTIENVYISYEKLHLSGLRAKTRDEYRRAFQRDILPTIGHIPVGALTRQDVVRLVDRIAERAPIMANRVLTYIRAFYNWCVGRGLIEYNPTIGIPKVHREISRQRVLSIEEVRALYIHCETCLPKAHANAFRFLILSCLRRAEVCNLSRQEITEDRIRVGSERSKTHQMFDTPLTNEMKKLLENCHHQGPYVFSNNEGSTPIDFNSRMLNRLTDLTGVNDWRIHDFRRAGTTFMEDNGVPRFVTERVLNHTDNSTTGIYAKSDYFIAKRNALELWESALLHKTQRNQVILLERKG